MCMCVCACESVSCDFSFALAALCLLQACLQTQHVQETLESREQLEALQGLIERIAYDPQQQQGQAQGGGVKSTQALLAELESAAAKY